MRILSARSGGPHQISAIRKLMQQSSSYRNYEEFDCGARETLANQDFAGRGTALMREMPQPKALQENKHEICRIQEKIATPQTTWLDYKAEQPFQSDPLQVFRSLCQ